MKTTTIQDTVIFAQPFYTQAGKYHDWTHIRAVRYWCEQLSAETTIKHDLTLLDSAAILHDIGRAICNEGHPYESARLATPFLERHEDISKREKEIIVDAVYHHGKDDIHNAATNEAVLLFDADKLEIVTVKGFLRCWAWLVDEREMSQNEAMFFLQKYVDNVRSDYLKTDFARKIADNEKELINAILERYTEE